jgi:uroporphyrin-3 C-methyltransferase
LARDLDRVRATAGVDVARLTLRLDDVLRVADQLPVSADVARRSATSPAQGVSEPAAGAADAAEATARARRAGPSDANPAGAKAAAARSGASAPVMAQPEPDGWFQPAWGWLNDRWDRFSQGVWREARALVRVTRVDAADALLLAPDQIWFLQANLKLRILNARLALLARQFDIARRDLRDAERMLAQYFDADSSRVRQARETLTQIAAQARDLTLPRPDESLAALATAQAGR